MKKFKIFLAVIFSTSMYADLEDDKVKNLCNTYQNEFNQYTAKNGSFKNKNFNSNALDWIAFFAEKSEQDIAFAEKNKATLNAFFCYGKGFGGINYNVKACDFERKGTSGDQPYGSGLVLLYQTGKKEEFKLTANAPNQFKTLEAEFHNTLYQLQDIYCFVPICDRINLKNLKNNFTNAFTSPCVEVKYTAALPIFVNKNGEMFLIASQDINRTDPKTKTRGPTYSVGYGGATDNHAPIEAFIKELSEELFSRKELSEINAHPTIQGKYYRKLLSGELDDFKAESNGKLATNSPTKDGKNLFVGQSAAIATFNNQQTTNGATNNTIEGLLLLPLEILGIQDYQVDKNKVDPAVEMLNHLRNTATLYYCKERNHFTIIPFEKFINEKKPNEALFTPIDRTFEGKTCPHFLEGRFLTTQPISKIFELIGAPKITN